MIEKIVIDIDDTMTHFTSYVVALLTGAPIDVEDVSHGWYEPEWPGIEDAISHLGDETTAEELWATLPESAWIKAPMAPHANWLLRYCGLVVGSENVAFFTKPTNNPSCSSGKSKWRNRYYPDVPMFMGGPKAFMANPRMLLIDDRDDNCQEFIKAGGRALLIPRPWNAAREYSSNPFPYVLRNLDRACQ